MLDARQAWAVLRGRWRMQLRLQLQLQLQQSQPCVRSPREKMRRRQRSWRHLRGAVEHERLPGQALDFDQRGLRFQCGGQLLLTCIAALRL